VEQDDDDRYDDTFATCARTFATLRVFSDHLTADEITRRLGVACSSSHSRGDPMGRTGNVRSTNGWFLTTEGVVSSNDLRRHVDWLLDHLAHADPDVFVDCRADVFCYWQSKSGHGGPELSPRQMARLARYRLPIGFDVYFPD
jgi:hypothetical protein